MLTGLPREATLEEAKRKPEDPDALDAYIATLDNRPDVAALVADLEAQKHRINSARAGHFPSIGVNANYYLTREGPQKGNTWDAGITFSLPLFAGGLVQAQAREAAERAHESELALAQTRRQAEIAIRTAFNDLESALKQITALESALRATEENYKEQEKNYRFGQATNLDVIQALNSFQDTKRNLDRTRFMAALLIFGGIAFDRMGVSQLPDVDCIGKVLMCEAEKWAIALGLSKVWLRSNITRRDAHALYLGLGYQTNKTSHLFTKQLPD